MVIRGVAKGLADAGALNWIALPEFERVPAPDPDYPRHADARSGSRAGATSRDAVKKREFSVSLLDGVTGSGKTEAYFEAVATRSAQAPGADHASRDRADRAVPRPLRRALRLPPARMALRPAERERRRVYRAVRAGEARVVGGARSALFLPFPSSA